MIRLPNPLPPSNDPLAISYNKLLAAVQAITPLDTPDMQYERGTSGIKAHPKFPPPATGITLPFAISVVSPGVAKVAPGYIEVQCRTQTLKGGAPTVGYSDESLFMGPVYFPGAQIAFDTTSPGGVNAILAYANETFGTQFVGISLASSAPPNPVMDNSWYWGDYQHPQTEPTNGDWTHQVLIGLVTGAGKVTQIVYDDIYNCFTARPLRHMRAYQAGVAYYFNELVTDGNNGTFIQSNPGNVSFGVAPHTDSINWHPFTLNTVNPPYIYQSSNGSQFYITVSNSGVLSTTPV